MKHKKLIIISSVLIITGAIIIGKFFFQIIPLTFSNEESDIPANNKALNYDEWFIITNKQQRLNLMKEGYKIPDINFEKNFLITSQYKIKFLWSFRSFCDSCTGMPNGHIIFDKQNSEQNKYYFYLMDKISLSQSAG
ncbi:hypothetical protein A2483_05650 [Candidatus Peregrinibacteria bacterium RIFOXYC2_FULL_33_13]|nr:MAG: hypothetical protein UR27_C0007G0040 [Candidatus Peregrinibacteria bacterium GW2011_GWA2_33_10]KKP40899.1 MAG: hypothetical protein UR30_C0003G0071 [Candidatus Peregrinibacteria bacterium GW2011_GWC2_33_13]OGJ50159.1 MAG: hypothetical protein A2229_00330 [Candidatus Peregrinibacteria bacterium RIFOXYA2_FULL_33_7]OGJ55223.1 MAG: hypothetical protein A2483_05650 [Candidatus Peregrinibacteria bacterium RIFOXYC2_FULL_33_13]